MAAMAAPASLAVLARSPTQQAAGGLGLCLGANERSRTGRQAVAAFLVRTTARRPSALAAAGLE